MAAHVAHPLLEQSQSLHLDAVPGAAMSARLAVHAGHEAGLYVFSSVTDHDSLCIYAPSRC